MEEAAKDWTPPDVGVGLTLRDQLLDPPDGPEWRITDLLPAGGNAVIAATAKSGKTTMVTNLIKSLVDGNRFLGSYSIARPEGRVAMWNLEVSEGQYLRWVADMRIKNTSAVSVMHLRGASVPIMTDRGFQWTVQWLVNNDISVWVIDPFARAASGIDEDRANQVGPWLERVDEIKRVAGVGEVILVTHTPKPSHGKDGNVIIGRETPRGSQRLTDWADVSWYISRDSEGRRFFRALGRDVEVAMSYMMYHPISRGLAIGGPASEDDFDE